MAGRYTVGRGEGSQPFYSHGPNPPSNPPSTFPQPNFPGPGGFPTFPTYYSPSQQPQAQIGLPRSPRPPHFPVQPTYPNIGDHTSAIPRHVDPTPFQLGTGYVDVNNYGQHLFPLPQANSQAAPDLGSAHGFANPGRGRRTGAPERFPSVPSSSGGATYGGSSYGEPSYEFGSPRVSEGTLQVPSRASSTRTHVGRHQASHHLRAPQKKAVVIGVDYTKHGDRRLRLEWGVIDARVMARFLQERLGFHPQNIRVLTDDKHDKRENRPTEKNIVAAMHWLVEGAQPGDSLFFYFSGHATQVEDKDGDEPDGWDECVCAMDYDGRKNPPTGIVVDDTMHDIMVKPLPKGCRLTAVFDCCHSGTILDLPYIYDSHGRVKQNRPDIVQRKASDAVVISLSACKDAGEAFEAGGGGALRRAFIEYAMTWGNGGTYLQAIGTLRTYMAAHRYVQRPQLSSSHWIDTDQRFIITG